MKLRPLDYRLARLAHSAAPLLEWLGNRETARLRLDLDAIKIEKPLFITGLARSGTTILLEELSRTQVFGTHCYRDFPFLMTPWFWNRFLDRFTRPQAPVERPHQDRIAITAESPEAFEEPLWQAYFPQVHARDQLHRLGANTRHSTFAAFFRDHLRKVLLIRGRPRYLSKGNYNLTRIEYLSTIFPDARFVIPVRHPRSHVRSLVRQHRLFTGYATEDKRVPRYLAAAGHFEFGPQRVPIRLSHEAANCTEVAWLHGDEEVGYAIQWASVYQFVHQLQSRGDDLAQRILVVRYEDFCNDPHAVLSSILRHADLDAADVLEGLSFEHIVASSSDSSDWSDEAGKTIWKETAPTARQFGYESA